MKTISKSIASSQAFILPLMFAIIGLYGLTGSAIVAKAWLTGMTVFTPEPVTDPAVLMIAHLLVGLIVAAAGFNLLWAQRSGVRMERQRLAA